MKDTTFTIRIESDLKKQVVKKAGANNLTLSQYVIRLIEKDLGIRN